MPSSTNLQTEKWVETMRYPISPFVEKKSAKIWSFANGQHPLLNEVQLFCHASGTAMMFVCSFHSEYCPVPPANMDSERQPLLTTRHSDRHYLNYDEVMAIRQDPKWRRVHIFMLLTFWTIIAAAVSLIIAWLVTAPACSTPMPVVPPVHLTLAPLAGIQGL